MVPPFDQLRNLVPLSVVREDGSVVHGLNMCFDCLNHPMSFYFGKEPSLVWCHGMANNQVDWREEGGIFLFLQIMVELGFLVKTTIIL